MRGRVLVPEKFSKLSSTARNPRSDRPRGNAECLGDLGIVHPDDITKYDGSPELLGHVGQGFFDGESVGDLLIELGPVGDAFWLLDDGDRPSLPTAELVETGVAGHSVTPCAERALALELVEAADDGHECFLARVGCVGVVASHTATERIEPLVVARQKLVHGTAVAGLGPGDEIFVGDFDRRSVGESGSLVAPLTR